MDQKTQTFLFEALCHRQRLDLTGEIVGAVAHDLNNALSVVNGNVELLLERLQESDAKSDESLLQDARTAHNWSGTAMASARRLLHFSRQLRSPAKAIPVNDLVAEAVELCRYRCEMDGLLLMSNLATDVGQINVPPGQIQQVVIAMVQNAREALSPEEGGSIQASTAAGDGVVRIEIEDDGEGVPEQLQERVFDLGYTTKESDQPAGIGLTIGRHLARAHGGDLKIESVDEGGGLQVLTLPRVED